MLNVLWLIIACLYCSVSFEKMDETRVEKRGTFVGQRLGAPA